MILYNSRVQAIRERVNGLSQDNYNFDFAPKNNNDIEFLANVKSDVSYLLNELTELYYKMKCLEDECDEKDDKLDTYEILLESNLKAKKNLITENVLQGIDNEYLIQTLKHIRNISDTEGEKQNSDLLKINQIANEALEGVE